MMKIQQSRRTFLKNNSLILFAAGHTCLEASLFAGDSSPETTKIKIGLLTDIHYADKEAAGSRYYRESLRKMDEAIEYFSKNKIDFAIELGDLVDAADEVDTELGYLKTIDERFQKISEQRHYVLGNHCVDTLTKEEFLGTVEKEKSYYSFDQNGFHFVILDACFNQDGSPYERKNSLWYDANIPPEELSWLEKDLKKNSLPVVVFVHQRLDQSEKHGINNAPVVRKLLENSGKTLAVFQGHNHVNDLQNINGIHYCTLQAMIQGSGIENNAYSLLEIAESGTITVNGFKNQKHQKIKQAV